MTKEDVIGTYEYQYNVSRHIIGYSFLDDNTVNCYVNYEAGKGDEHKAVLTWEIVGEEIHVTGKERPNSDNIVTEIFEFTSSGDLSRAAKVKHDPETGLSPRQGNPEPKRKAILLRGGVKRISHVASKIKPAAPPNPIPASKDWSKPTTDPDNLV